MFRSIRRTPARPLPPGLRICETCGEARGRTPRGPVSACYCSGLVCNRCGGRARRPITDYYDHRDGSWWHVPYFGLGTHRCELAPGEAPRGTGWTRLEPDPDVREYQQAVTRLALESTPRAPERPTKTER
jgi:hypothetical protein